MTGPVKESLFAGMPDKIGIITTFLALLELMKTKPFGAVWDYYCWRQDVPVGFVYMDEIQIYEKRVLALRR